MNITVIVIVVVLAIALIVFVNVKNLRDKKKEFPPDKLDDKTLESRMDHDRRKNRT